MKNINNYIVNLICVNIQLNKKAPFLTLSTYQSESLMMASHHQVVLLLLALEVNIVLLLQRLLVPYSVDTSNVKS